MDNWYLINFLVWLDCYVDIRLNRSAGLNVLEKKRCHQSGKQITIFDGINGSKMVWNVHLRIDIYKMDVFYFFPSYLYLYPNRKEGHVPSVSFIIWNRKYFIRFHELILWTAQKRYCGLCSLIDHFNIFNYFLFVQLHICEECGCGVF